MDNENREMCLQNGAFRILGAGRYPGSSSGQAGGSLPLSPFFVYLAYVFNKWLGI